MKDEILHYVQNDTGVWVPQLLEGGRAVEQSEPRPGFEHVEKLMGAGGL